MKRKRFYSNKKRNRKWTEEQQGRKIDFADKYVYSGPYSDKFDYLRPKKKKKKRLKAEKLNLIAKRILSVLFCFAVISCGYTLMDVYMDRNSMPEKTSSGKSSQAAPGIAQVSVNFYASAVESASLDNAAMLDAVIDEATKSKSNAVEFDLKREDGTLAYTSSLAAVNSYNAASLPATDLKGSVEKLMANDFMCIARICCFKDNVAPFASNDSALKAGNGALITDSQGSAYLNPDNEYVYDYIKGIVTDGKEAGITVFMLDGCVVPDGAGGYNDYTQSLVKKLKDEFKNSVKFIFPVNVEFTQERLQSFESESAMLEKIIEENPLDKNEIYVITTDTEEEQLRFALREKQIVRYIIKKQVSN